jgi:hypothetical protein
MHPLFLQETLTFPPKSDASSCLATKVAKFPPKYNSSTAPSWHKLPYKKRCYLFWPVGVILATNLANRNILANNFASNKH